MLEAIVQDLERVSNSPSSFRDTFENCPAGRLQAQLQRFDH